MWSHRDGVKYEIRFGRRGNSIDDKSSDSRLLTREDCIVNEQMLTRPGNHPLNMLTKVGNGMA